MVVDVRQREALARPRIRISIRDVNCTIRRPSRVIFRWRGDIW